MFISEKSREEPQKCGDGKRERANIHTHTHTHTNTGTAMPTHSQEVKQRWCDAIAHGYDVVEGLVGPRSKKRTKEGDVCVYVCVCVCVYRAREGRSKGKQHDNMCL